MFRTVFILALSALLASASPWPDREKIHAAKEKCIAETGIDPALVKGPPTFAGPADEKQKCFTACMMKDLGKFKDDGSFDLPGALEKIPDDLPDKDAMTEALTACAEKKGDNECDTAWAIFECLHAQGMPFMHRPRPPL